MSCFQRSPNCWSFCPLLGMMPTSRYHWPPCKFWQTWHSSLDQISDHIWGTDFSLLQGLYCAYTRCFDCGDSLTAHAMSCTATQASSWHAAPCKGFVTSAVALCLPAVVCANKSPPLYIAATRLLARRHRLAAAHCTLSAKHYLLVWSPMQGLTLPKSHACCLQILHDMPSYVTYSVLEYIKHGLMLQGYHACCDQQARGQQSGSEAGQQQAVGCADGRVAAWHNSGGPVYGPCAQQLESQRGCS